MNIHQFYLKHIAKQTGYRATWEPNRPLFVGAIGKLERGVFTIFTNLEKEGIIPEVVEDETEGFWDYTSYDSVSINFKLAGQAPLAGSALTEADAGVTIDFKNNEAVVFQADKTLTHQIINMAEIEKAIIEKYRKKEWPKDWLIVVQLIEAESATIIISNSTSNQIDLKAEANVGTSHLKLTDASLGLHLVREQGSSFKILAKNGITPLYRVMGIRHPLFGKPGLSTKSLTEETDEVLEVQDFDPEELNSVDGETNG